MSFGSFAREIRNLVMFLKMFGRERRKLLKTTFSGAFPVLDIFIFRRKIFFERKKFNSVVGVFPETAHDAQTLLQNRY